MSNLEGDREKGLEHEALSRLDRAVEQAVVRIEFLQGRLAEVQAQEADVRGLLGQFTAGELDPAEVMSHVRTLEAENDQLRKRLREGKEAVERLLARIRFLEEQG